MRRIYRRQGRQLELFQKEVKTPGWQRLPSETKRSVTTLLAQLLNKHRHVVREDCGGKGAGDE